MRAFAPILVLVAGGCTWVTPVDLESRKTEVDDDGDGFAKTEDCDDNAADVNPDADEIWYDGIDQDCGKDDDFDADADGWVASEHTDEATANVAGTGSLPGGDCDDSLFEVNPAADDIWRDGADQDCSGNDDFDVDGDGYVRDEDAGQTTDYVEGSGDAPGGDCDDERDTVNPGASDTWRDGVDMDCSGHDDYDVDGDGYVRDEDEGLPTRYVEGSGTAPAGDCDDEEATINPATAEVWYDSIDNDCSELTDDGDADGDTYVALVFGGDDCDDDRADVNPDAIENLSDAVDHDCDGDAVTFVMESLAANVDWLSSLVWSSPHDAVLSANNRSIFLSIASDRVDVTRPSTTGGSSTVVYYDSALAFGWDLTDMAAGPEELIDWQRNAGADPVFTLTDGHDFIATDDALFGATGLMLPTGRALRMGGYNLTTNARFGISYRLNPTTSAFSDFTDISMEMDDDGNLHAVGCESGSSWLQYMRASPANLQSTDYDEAAAYEDMALEVCELDFYNSTTGTLTARTSSGVQTWDFGPLEVPPLLVEDALMTEYTAIDIEVPRDGNDDWLVIADLANLGITFVEPDGSDTLYSLGNAPRAVNAAFDPAHTGVGDPDMFVALVDGSGDAYMLVGQPLTGFDSYAIPVSFTATNAVAWPDPTGTYVLVAVIGQNDVQYGIAER